MYSLTVYLFSTIKILFLMSLSPKVDQKSICGDEFMAGGSGLITTEDLKAPGLPGMSCWYPCGRDHGTNRLARETGTLPVNQR